MEFKDWKELEKWEKESKCAVHIIHKWENGHYQVEVFSRNGCYETALIIKAERERKKKKNRRR